MIELHQRAMRHSVVIVSMVAEDRWDAPTPCAKWTLRDLLVHMIAENNGFAAAASGEAADRSVWDEHPLGADPRREYVESADRVVRAFASPAPEFWLPNIGPTPFPADRAIGFHLLDYVVHSWDVAAALRRTLALEPDLVEAAREVAERDVPDGPRRDRPGAGFQRPVPGERTDPLANLLAFLGRDPDWRP